MKIKLFDPFAVITVLFLAALTYQISGGVDYHAPPVFKVSADEPAARSYAKAVTILETGSPTNNAIALLKDALTQDSKNAEYHAALACAYTDRAAVIYRAFYYHRLVLLKRREEITAQRQSIVTGIFGGHGLQAISTVPPYHCLRLKDDGASFRMSDPEAVNSIAALEDKAAKEWNTAHQNAGSKAQAADIDYQNACSDRIFEEMGQNTNEITAADPSSTDLVRPLTEKPFATEAFNQIHDAALTEPDVSMYWVLTAQYVYGIRVPNSDKKQPPPRPYLLRALAIEPDNNALRMSLCDLERMHSQFEVTDLLSAAKHDPKNSVPLLLASMAILDHTHYRRDYSHSWPESSVKAVTAMEKSLTVKDRTDAKQALVFFEQGVKLNNIHILPYNRPFAPLLLEGEQWGSPYQIYDSVSSEYLFEGGLSNIYRLSLAEAIEKRPDRGSKLLNDFASLIIPLAKTKNFDKSLPPYQEYCWQELYAKALDDRSALLTKYGDKLEASKAAASAAANDIRFKEFMKKYDDWCKELNEDDNGHMPY